MYILAIRKANITRIYYGPDSRMSALFLGGLLYLESERFENYLKKFTEKTQKIGFLIILVLSIIPFFFVEGESYFTYRLFMVFYTLLMGFLVLSLYIYEKNLILGHGRVRRKIGPVGTILYYLGSRSYHIYLWQYMLEIFFAYALATGTGSKIGFFLLEMILLIVISEISYNIFKIKFKKTATFDYNYIIYGSNGLCFKLYQRFQRSRYEKS